MDIFLFVLAWICCGVIICIIYKFIFKSINQSEFFDTACGCITIAAWPFVIAGSIIFVLSFVITCILGCIVSFIFSVIDKV